MAGGWVRSAVRAGVPLSVLPLALVACGLASAPWLRAFPADVLAVPLFGAVLLGVLVPVVTVGIGVRRLRVSALIDVAVWAFYTLLVGLREPAGFADLYAGLVHEPAQLLSYALPLVDPRTLLVAPLTLCWIGGALAGECLARAWPSVLPYAALLGTFGLAYAGSVRAVPGAASGRRVDTLLAGLLLLTLLLLRAGQAWLEQDLDAEAAQSDGLLPVRGVLVGAATSIGVTLLAALAVQSSWFHGPPASVSRRPPVDATAPLSPVAFVAGLRPDDPAERGAELFRVDVDRPTSSYVGLADVDTYDGDGWSFTRTFLPSGGVVPADSDPALRPHGSTVTQRYTIAAGPLTNAPWMPFQSRPQNVTGMSVNVDSADGMIVPSVPVRAGQRYAVQSVTRPVNVNRLRPSAALATSAPAGFTALPGAASTALVAVVRSFEAETRTPSSTPVAFLQALATDLRERYSLARASRGAVAGNTGFASVLASILGPTRTASPEQYATLVALIARQVGVPARVVAGFRLGASGTVPAGSYAVRSAQAWTWVEIPVQGRGWVVLDAAPRTYGRQAPLPRASAAPSAQPTPTLTPHQLATAANGPGHAVAPRSAVPAADRATVWPLAGAAVALLVTVLLAGLLLRKRVRVRARRRSRDPRLLLIGAWQEGLDVLVEAGLPDPTSLTTAEIVTSTQDRLGADCAVHARYLGERANAAIFSPASPIGVADADAAWRAERALRAAVRRRLGRRARLRADLRFRRIPRAPMRLGARLGRPLDRGLSRPPAGRSRASGSHRRHR